MTKTSVRPIRPVWHEWDLIRAFGQRDLKSKFNGTLLGWLWSLVVPLASLGIYTLIFGGLFKMVPTEIASRHQGIGIFAVWLFAGLTIWGFFQNSINAGINGLMGSGSLLQKVSFPAYSAVLGSCLAIGVQSAVEVGLLLIVLALLANVSWTWLLLVPFLVLLIVFTGAVSVIVSIWNIYVRDLAHLVGVGRGTDLLLYALVVGFLIQILSSFRRNAARERQITRLARRIALDTAPDPHQEAAERHPDSRPTRDSGHRTA